MRWIWFWGLYREAISYALCWQEPVWLWMRHMICVIWELLLSIIIKVAPLFPFCFRKCTSTFEIASLIKHRPMKENSRIYNNTHFDGLICGFEMVSWINPIWMMLHKLQFNQKSRKLCSHSCAPPSCINLPFKFDTWWAVKKAIFMFQMCVKSWRHINNST